MHSNAEDGFRCRPAKTEAGTPSYRSAIPPTMDAPAARRAGSTAASTAATPAASSNTPNCPKGTDTTSSFCSRDIAVTNSTAHSPPRTTPSTAPVHRRRPPPAWPRSGPSARRAAGGRIPSCRACSRARRRQARLPGHTGRAGRRRYRRASRVAPQRSHRGRVGDLPRARVPGVVRDRRRPGRRARRLLPPRLAADHRGRRARRRRGRLVRHGCRARRPVRAHTSAARRRLTDRRGVPDHHRGPDQRLRGAAGARCA